MRLNAFIQALKPKEIRQSSDDNGAENVEPNADLYHLALFNVACAENYGVWRGCHRKHKGATRTYGDDERKSKWWRTQRISYGDEKRH